MTYTTLSGDTQMRVSVLVDGGQTRRGEENLTRRFPLETTAEALDSDRMPSSVKTVVAVS